MNKNLVKMAQVA